MICYSKQNLCTNVMFYQEVSSLHYWLKHKYFLLLFIFATLWFCS